MTHARSTVVYRPPSPDAASERFRPTGKPVGLHFLTAAALLVIPLGAASASGATKETAASTAEPHGRVEIRGEWFYVDGEPFLVKGVGYSPYRPGQTPWNNRVDLAAMERDFKRITEAGFNTLRTWSPLPPEALALADKYGLLVFQGIWVERNGNYTTSAFRQAMFEVIKKEVERAKGQRNILAFLVGNELLPELVYETGVPEIEALLRDAARVVKQADPSRLVSYANWPSLAFLDHTIWDVISFNLYPYEPVSVSHSFGYRSYIEHLRRTVAHGKPLVITEVGLSVSPTVGSRPGYGGWTLETQRTALVKLWDDLFQAGAQGGAIFEWNDEWWKHADTLADEQTHDERDPEEWFGLTEFTSKEQADGRERPVLQDLKTYNQAVLLSPVTGKRYQDAIPVTVYAEENVAQVRARLDKGKWETATKVNRHWWKLFLPLGPKEKVGDPQVIVEALDADHRLVVRRERAVVVGPPLPSPTLSVTTDRPSYDVVNTLEPVHYAITVTNSTGAPLGNRPVFWSIAEPQSKAELTQTKATDANGRIEGTYLVHEPGIISLAAATPRDPSVPELRVGDEVFLVVRQVPNPSHQPSMWEAHLPEEVREGLKHSAPAFQLHDAGTERIVNYARYGSFHDVGTPNYHYEVQDWKGLADAVGEGIYPNEAGLLTDPAYQTAQKAGKLEGSHWDFTFHEDAQLAFFKWAGTDEEAGVKQFYTALTLERAGLYLQAVKAYDAVLVHFPTSVGWTAFDPPTPWYVGKVARDKIEALLRLHPELGLRLEGARVIVENGFDNSVDNDRISASPGTLVSVPPADVNPPTVDVASLPRKQQRGKGRVQLVQYANDHWQLLVNGKPWVVQGLTYKPTAVGDTPDVGPLPDWMAADRNGNGQLDVFETFVDANRNNRQDPDEPTVGDFALIKSMGVNTLRLYHTDHQQQQMKAVLRQLYERYGFMVMMGDFVGMYTVGSGAKWEQGTNYLDKHQRKRMAESVKQMVRDFKDEPYVLMWVLGNENNYGGVHGIVGGAGNAGQYPKEYYGFINELASWIHAADPNHPVALGNGDLLFLDVIAKAAPAIDIFGANAYHGWHGVGRSFFEEVKAWTGKPVLITEYGCPAYQTGRASDIAERDQALYHFGSWVDLADNMAGRGIGNALGGVVFEWTDEWWKGGQPPRFSPTVQETRPNWAGPFPGGWNFEEWYGVTSQGDGTKSPFLRVPRVSYRLYQGLWNNTSEVQ